MTKGERKLRQDAKKWLIAEGVLPPPKKRLNRKKYIDQAWEEYNAQPTNMSDFATYQYLLRAISIMSGHRDRNTLNPSLEAVGAAKVLKLATALRIFDAEAAKRGLTQYKIKDLMEAIKPIIDA